MYEQDGAKYHQLILPIEFRAQVIELHHDEQEPSGSEAYATVGMEAILLEYSAPRCHKLGKKR